MIEARAIDGDLVGDDVSDPVMSDCPFLSIDAEGAELEILKGAETTLKGNNVFVAAACYHVPQEFQNVGKYLKEIGFKVYSSPENEYLYGLRRL